MITFTGVLKMLDLVHVPSAPKSPKNKKQKYNGGPRSADQESLSRQNISIPEQKMRVGLPPGVSTSNNGRSHRNTTVNHANHTNNTNHNTHSNAEYNATYNNHRAPPPDPRKDLESRILHLWKRVWLGLYQVENAQGPYHYERIEALYLGAGLTKTYRMGELKVLNRHFSEYSRNTGIAGLKLYENLSIKTLRAIIEVLEAYEREIPNLERIYTILRSAQLELYQEDGFGGYTGQIYQTQRRYLSVAEPLEKRLLHYDARMDVLAWDIYDEAMELHAFRPGMRKGLYIYQKVFLATQFGTVHTIKVMLGDYDGDVQTGQLLHYAAGRKIDVVDVLELLLDRGAPINQTMYENHDWSGRFHFWMPLGTALHEAGSWDNVKAARYLLSRGIDASIKS
ncbi:hypothetical protein PHISP_02368 [Aspergillus sp. HF37]|nr:hypothetical protein PHISP_02368 [Aspergillus sp. HF37]